MAQTIIDWQLAAASISNPDGSMAATFSGTTAVAGPGPSALGPRPSALAFGPGASCRVAVSPGQVDSGRFCVRVLFRATAPVTTRNNLVESNALPFALFLEPGDSPQTLNVVASVQNGVVGWTSAHSSNRLRLEVGTWYVASLVYDLDTLALLVDDRVVAVSAFPRGAMAAGSSDALLLGTWVDGARWPLHGEVAGVQLWTDIPAELEARLDAERGSPEWHLTFKENALRPTLNLGPKTADFYFDPATLAWFQSYALAVIGYTEGDATAFVMYGGILAKWRSDAALRNQLGSLASDEINGRRGGSRKSVFRNGCIYWSPQTPAVAVLGRMYLDFELLGEGTSVVGLPTADEVRIPGGREQHFQWGRMYLRDGASNAFEVHGGILGKYQAEGPARWGFPVSNELTVLSGTTEIGRVSHFESCSIYWSGATGAWVIYGEIRNTYLANGGPTGELGFPTSDEADLPAGAGRYNTFQRGSILWFHGPTFVCWPFNFRLGRLDTKEEDRDIFDLDGQNDLFCRICIDVNGSRVFDRKIPDGAVHFSSANILDLAYLVPYGIVPNDPNLTVSLRVEVWESDSGQVFGGGNAHLGTFTKVLDVGNAWGLRDSPDGTFSAAGFGPWVNRLDWSIVPIPGPSTPFDFWGVTNGGTSAIEWREYAAAFSDVDPDFELDFGLIDDGLKALFYELVVKGVAKGGNCFGMSLEAIYAWKGHSRLGRPLSRYTTWANVENDFNVKHAYQVGADAIWWFLGQFAAGRTHDPKAVFHATWDAFNRGLNPVVCISQNYDFSGAPHCILPIGWDTSVSPWRMTVFDPNCQNTQQTLTVDPGSNVFDYSAAGNSYRGGQWSGGRFHYMPWSVLNHRQRTPVWDAILLLLGGVVVIFADSTEVGSLTDEHGNSLLASSVTSREHLTGKLLQVPGILGGGPIAGHLYVGTQTPPPVRLPPGIARATELPREAVGRIAHERPRRPPVSELRTAIGASRLAERVPVATDAELGSLSGPRLMEIYRERGPAILRSPQPTDLDTIRATLSGRREGRLDAYIKRPMQAVQVKGDVSTGEAVQLGFERLGARDNQVSVRTDRGRQYEVSFVSKLGAGTDFLRVTLEGLAADASRPVQLNVQPGLTAVDVLTTGGPTSLRVLVEGRVDGKAILSDFGTQIDGGARVALPDRTDPAVLKVSTIDTLFGVATNLRTIPRR